MICVCTVMGRVPLVVIESSHPVNCYIMQIVYSVLFSALQIISQFHTYYKLIG